MAFDTASKTGKQYLYTGRGPLDPKSLVSTYAQLVDAATWTEGSSIVAYNGMLVAVWCNTADTTKNGIYLLHDSAVKNKFKAPDVTSESNWHKLAELSDISALTAQLSDLSSELTSIDARLTALEEESDVITYGYRSGFPVEGEEGKLYVAADEKKSYVWFAGEYLLVSGSSSDYVEPDVIYGGSAD
jgi:hypothetical protein